MDAEAVSRILSLVSHELRSPLGVIRGYLKWLEQQAPPLSDQQRQAVTGALRASDRMTELVSEVSALAHLQRGETPMEPATTTLDVLMTDVVGAARLSAPASIRFDLGESPSVEMSVDRPLLQAALVTLAAAVVAAQPRETVMSISAQTEPSAEPQGIRIDLHAQSDPFAELVDAPLNLTRGGLGLRLAIAAEIIAGHGGRIEERREASRLVGMVVWLPEELRTKDEELRAERRT